MHQVRIDHKSKKFQTVLINLLCRTNTLSLTIAVVFYIFGPILSGNNATPTLVSINGSANWDVPIYLTIYGCQIVFALGVLFSLGGYDAIFMQCIMVLMYRFRTMSNIAFQIETGPERSHARDKEILIDLYEFHLSVLK